MVPSTAPMTPDPSALQVCPQAVPMTAPANPPMISRTANTGGAVRGGVLGSLSLTSSATARMLKITTVTRFPTQEAQVFCKLNQVRKTAQATAAGAVRDRNPATTPINSANRRTSTCVTAIPPGQTYSLATMTGMPAGVTGPSGT